MGHQVPRDFIGREDEIASIRKYVNMMLVNHGSQIFVVLNGLPVVGKSALAKRLMSEFSSNFEDSNFLIDMKGSISHYVNVRNY